MHNINTAHIKQWVKPGAEVLDLGCGDGTLLAELRDSCNANGLGIEIDAENITQCLEKGLSVVQQDLNLGLGNFGDRSFDLVLMTFALQETKSPADVLQEMVRIGKQVIVTIPNMGYWRCRWQIFFGGRMPVVSALPSQWYESENIHLCTLEDFEKLCHENGIKILERFAPGSRVPASMIRRGRGIANFFAESVSYRLSA